MPVYMTKYILLNGPARSGKSEVIAPRLQQLLTSGLYQGDPSAVVMDSFAAPMKHFISVAMGEKYANLKKDTMSAVWSGWTPREVLIDMSERWMKRQFGDDIFGRLFHHRILRLDPIPHVVISDDCGFDCEPDALDPHRKNVFIIRVERPGFDFKGDSRSYLDDPDYVLRNDGDLAHLEDRCQELAHWFITQAR